MHNEIGDLAHTIGARAKRVKGLMGLLPFLFSHFARLG